MMQSTEPLDFSLLPPHLEELEVGPGCFPNILGLFPPSLKVLSVIRNPLQGLPQGLLTLSNLEKLVLAGGQTTALPIDFLKNVPKLKSLHLSGNALPTFDPPPGTVPLLASATIVNNGKDFVWQPPTIPIGASKV
jgi:Leucine-rich repeat (LRR) protein